MSYEPNKEGSSNLPFSAPPSYKAMSAPAKPSLKAPKKTTSSRKQLKNAKRSNRSSISVRGLITGLLILIATTIAVTAVISPSLLNKIASGEFIQVSQTCKIKETNKTLFFDTTCGKFEWDTDRQPGDPSSKLVEGETYTIKSVGLRIGPAQVFPKVITYDKVA